MDLSLGDAVFQKQYSKNSLKTIKTIKVYKNNDSYKMRTGNLKLSLGRFLIDQNRIQRDLSLVFIRPRSAAVPVLYLPSPKSRTTDLKWT